MNQKRRIWITKSLNERQRNYAQNVDLQIKEIALTKIQTLQFPRKLPEAEAWIFTSQNAVKNMPDRIMLQQAQQNKDPFSKIVYASGKQTAKALQKKGFTTKYGPDETALSLAKTIAEEGIKSALFFCGNMRRNELPKYLIKKGVQIKEVVVYHTILDPKIVPTQKGDSLFFMSPSAVESYAMINEFTLEIDYYSIGETTANALRKKGIQKSYIAAEASFESMLKKHSTENK